jgi:hypothetical protein
MLKSTTAIMAAALLAAVITVLSVPSAKVDAHPSLSPATTTPACAERPWPYLNCVGTGYSFSKVRLVTTDRLPQ